jgi:hypothetical protein
MRALGMVFIVLGILALLIRSITYFTTETQVGPLRFLAWDVSQPHTIIINPIAGILAVIAGFVLLTMNRRQLAT